MSSENRRVNAETDTEISSYPLSPHLRARMMGAALGVIGVLLLILTLLIAVLHLSLDLLVLAVAIALAAIYAEQVIGFAKQETMVLIFVLAAVSCLFGDDP